MDILAPRAETFHRLNGRVRHTGECTAPARVSGADHDRFMVGEQDRRAIRCQDTDEKIGPVGDHGIRARTVVLRPRPFCVNNFSRMHLVDRREVGLRKERCDGDAPVLVDRGAVVVASVADVEAGELAVRYTAAAPKEAMRQAAQRDGRG